MPPTYTSGRPNFGKSRIGARSSIGRFASASMRAIMRSTSSGEPDLITKTSIEHMFECGLEFHLLARAARRSSTAQTRPICCQTASQGASRAWPVLHAASASSRRFRVSAAPRLCESSQSLSSNWTRVTGQPFRKRGTPRFFDPWCGRYFRDILDSRTQGGGRARSGRVGTTERQSRWGKDA